MKLNPTLVKIVQSILRNYKLRVSANITQTARKNKLKICCKGGLGVGKSPKKNRIKDQRVIEQKATMYR